MSQPSIRIGGASGYWGDASLATAQLLDAGQLDYLVYDFLAEITMSILARARSQNPELGYATDFVTAAMVPNLKQISEQGVKVVANAGGVNPEACARVLEAAIAEQGLALTVAVVSGDDLLQKKPQLQSQNLKEMFTGEDFPALDSIASINAYLGAFPIAKALDLGADIVVTGRCVDSAVTLGACIHEFAWQAEDLDKLAQGSLAGHLLECGTQACGGNFTDWDTVGVSLADAGYPIAEISSCGEFTCSKVANTGGVVNVGTVAEQMLYEIGDPKAYYLPDVVCDFTQVTFEQIGADLVKVVGAKGQGCPSHYKTSATYSDGFRSGQVFTVYGPRAAEKGQLVADIVFKRACDALNKAGLGDFRERCVEIIGAENHYGARANRDSREVDVKIAVTHENPKAIQLFLKEATGMVLAGPPGICGFAGARPKPSPVVRLFSCLVAKEDVDVRVIYQGESELFTPAPAVAESIAAELALPVPQAADEYQQCLLEQLAFGRSGDKGNKANIGIIARKPEYLPYIAAALSAENILPYFTHFMENPSVDDVDVFYLPGSHAINILLDKALGGGGVASLRNDSQAKGFAQLLMDVPISVPKDLL